jgi:hypothetical protein
MPYGHSGQFGETAAAWWVAGSNKTLFNYFSIISIKSIFPYRNGKKKTFIFTIT